MEVVNIRAQSMKLAALGGATVNIFQKAIIVRPPRY